MEAWEQRSQLGLISRKQLDERLKLMAEVIVTPGGQQYWMSGAHEAVGAPKAGLIERYVEANRGTIVPYNERMQWMMLRISGSVVRLRAGSAGNN